MLIYNIIYSLLQIQEYLQIPACKSWSFSIKEEGGHFATPTLFISQISQHELTGSRNRRSALILEALHYADKQYSNAYSLRLPPHT